MKLPLIVVATAIANAAQLHEASYDSAAAEAATRELEAKESANPNKLFKSLEYSQWYRCSLKDAAVQACTTLGLVELSDPIHHLLRHSWDEALEWAYPIMAARGTPPNGNICGCPHCGSITAPKVQTNIELGFQTALTEAFGYAVICIASESEGGCGASSGFWPTPEEATAAWNRRF